MPRRRPARSAQADARLRCGRRRSVHYCDGCQKNDWKATSRGARRPRPPRDVRARGAAVRVVPGLRVVHRRARGPWMCYRSCCGATSAKRASGAGRVARRPGAAPSACPRCGEAPAADDATAFARARARRRRRGGRDLVLGATLLYGPGAGACGPRRPQAAAQADRGRRGGRRGAELFIGAANHASRKRGARSS